MRALHVTVTRDDIRQGRQLEPRDCALAIALRRAQCMQAIVGLGEATTYDPQTWVVHNYRLPPVAVAFVARFDTTPWFLRRWLVQPLTFTLQEVAL